MDAWTWTLQAMELMLAKSRGVHIHLEPPCPELVRSVHLRPETGDKSWSDEQHQKFAAAIAAKAANKSTADYTMSERTIEKYLPELLRLKAANPDLTQAQLGSRVGISQSAVSVLLRSLR